MASPTASNYKRAYVLDKQDDGYYYTPAFAWQTKAARIDMVMEDIPAELDELRKWSYADCIRHHFRDLLRKHAYMTFGTGNNKSTRLHARYFSLQENFKAGRFAALEKIRDHFLDPVYQGEMLKAQSNPKAHLAKRGTGFDVVWSVQPHHAGINLSQIAQKHAANAEMLKLLEEVNTSNLTEAVPELAQRDGIYVRQWAKNAAMTFSSEGNFFTTSAQVNVSKLGQNLGTAIKGKGEPHVDSRDVPTYYTVVLFLSNPPPEWYEGKFIIYSTRVFCEGATFGALVFCAKHPHSCRGYGFYAPGLDASLKYSLPKGFSIPKVPNGLPYGRVAIPVYPRNDAMKPKRKWLRSGNELPKEALAVFGTRRNLQEWGMRLHMSIRTKNDTRSAKQWCEAFSWKDNGVKEKPDLWIASLCLSEDIEADKKYKKHYQNTLATGCGNVMPKDRKPRAAKGKGKKFLAAEVQIRCHGLTKKKVAGQFEPCRIHLKHSRFGNHFCKRHQSQAPAGR